MNWPRSILLIAAVSYLEGCDWLRESNTQPVPPPGLIGVWLITETATTTSAGTVVNNQPQPGIYIFTERHFSNILIPNERRALFRGTPTDQERLAVYDNFTTDAGTYDATDTTLKTKNIIAKIPNVMTDEAAGITYRYSLQGDTLLLSFGGGWAPSDGEIKYRLRRIE